MLRSKLRGNAVNHPFIIFLDEVESAQRARSPGLQGYDYHSLGRVGNLGAGLDHKTVDIALHLQQLTRPARRQRGPQRPAQAAQHTRRVIGVSNQISLHGAVGITRGRRQGPRRRGGSRARHGGGKSGRRGREGRTCQDGQKGGTDTWLLWQCLSAVLGKVTGRTRQKGQHQENGTRYFFHIP